MSPSSAGSGEPTPTWTALPDDNAVLALLCDHYGLAADVFADHRCWRNRSGTVWLAHRCVDLTGLERLDVVGLRVRRNDAQPSQASINLMRRFFATATRHVLRLDSDDAVAAYWARQTRHLDPPEGDGYYVVIGPRGRVLGRARVSGGWARPELPRHDKLPMVIGDEPALPRPLLDRGPAP